jgi:hypothetical protein
LTLEVKEMRAGKYGKTLSQRTKMRSMTPEAANMERRAQKTTSPNKIDRSRVRQTINDGSDIHKDSSSGVQMYPSVRTSLRCRRDIIVKTGGEVPLRKKCGF